MSEDRDDPIMTYEDFKQIRDATIQRIDLLTELKDQFEGISGATTLDELIAKLLAMVHKLEDEVLPYPEQFKHREDH
jgi:hypothetical protein